MALALALHLLPGLVVEGDTTCPSPEMVAQAVASILPEDFNQAPFHLQLSRENEWGTTQAASSIHLVLFDASGQRRAERSLRANADCRLLARRVAAVAAAWQAELSDEPLPATEPPASEAVEPQTPRPLGPLVIQSNLGLHLALEMALGLSYVENGGLTTAFGLGGGRTWNRVGVLAGLWAEGTRESSIGDFSRVTVEAGPTVALVSGPPRVELRVQGLAAALFLAKETQADVGCAIGVRALTASSSPRPFLDAQVLLWPRLPRDPSLLALSPVEVLFTLGLSLGGA